MLSTLSTDSKNYEIIRNRVWRHFFEWFWDSSRNFSWFTNNDRRKKSIFLYRTTVDNKINKATLRSVYVAAATSSPDYTLIDGEYYQVRWWRWHGSRRFYSRRPHNLPTHATCGSCDQLLEGFGVTLTSEAREVLCAFMNGWNHVDRTSPNYRRGRHDERVRVLWTYRRDRAALILKKVVQSLRTTRKSGKGLQREKNKTNKKGSVCKHKSTPSQSDQS